MNWSGGKDSALALYYVQQSSQFTIEKLLTSVSEKYNRISMHGVRNELLEKQASMLGIELQLLTLPENTSMQEYDFLMKETMTNFEKEGYTHSIFGDIFLEDLKKYREEKLDEVGIKGVFPLWKKDTKETVMEFISLGFKAVVVCASADKLDKSFVGRTIDQDFINDLPCDVDPCGENGEFHTFVYDGPIFKHPIPVTIGRKVLRQYHKGKNWNSRFWFCDVY